MNKNLMLSMTSWMPMLFNADAPAGGSGGGGGAATVTAPAAAPAAPAAPAAARGSGSSTPSGGAKGLFAGIRHQKPPEKPTDKTATPPATPPADGKDPKAAAAAAAPATTPADPEKLTRPVMGRFNTIREVEDAMKRSQDEGVRLFQENKAIKEAHQKELAERESQLAALKAELEDVRTRGVFKELSKDELELLKKENPAAYTDYIIEKRERDRAAAEQKARRESEARALQERQASVRSEVIRKDEEMRANKTEWPGYEDQVPVMQQFMDLTKPEGSKFSPITGYPWTGELLYYAAKGLAAVQAERAAVSAKSEAEKAAAAKAAADAAAASGPKGGDGKTAPLGPVDDDKAYKESVLRAAPRKVFGTK